MRLVNIHSFRPQTLCEYFGLVLSYTPFTIALALILGIMLPYMQLWCFDVALRSPMLFGWSFFGALPIFTLLLVAFFKAAFIGPGYVDPRSWSSAPRVVTGDRDGACESSAMVASPTVSMTLPDGSLRYCSKCGTYKPDGSHHCSDCNRCVLKMDHHCPWINNCVGLRNEKFFLQFLAYIPVCATHIVLTITLGYQRMQVEFTFRHVGLIILVMAAATIGFVLGLFAVFHAYLIAVSETTLERRFRKPSAKERSWSARCLTCNLPPRDILRYRFQSVLGESVYAWLLPVGNDVGNVALPL